MSQISINALSFTYEGSYDPIFEDVSFTIDTDWKLGFIGRNGKGKTTFLHLLLGKYDYSGRISAAVDFAYFPYAVKDQGRMTYEVMEAMAPQAEQWEMMKELSLLAVEADVLYRPYNTLSQGEQVKVMLAILFLKENAFLLIDEPTNHLDMASREVVENYLNKKKGFIVISHDRRFLDACIDHVLSINKMNIDIQKGNYSTWAANKQQQDQFELDKNEKLKKEIDHLQASARRTANWSNTLEKTKKGGTRIAGLRPDRGFIGHKAAKMMKRSKTAEARKQKAIEEKEELLQNIDWAADLKIETLAYSKNNLVEMRDLQIIYDDRKITAPINLTINHGDRIALMGKNGAGKSSVMKLIAGKSIQFAGNLHLGSQLKVSIVSQTTDHLRGDLSDYACDAGIDESLFKAILRKLGFQRIQFEKDMLEFSSGQKKKVLLAGSLCEPSHLYLWDEPMNFIDIISRAQIEDLLITHRPTMVFVEHDRTFMERVATEVCEIIRIAE